MTSKTGSVILVVLLVFGGGVLASLAGGSSSGVAVQETMAQETTTAGGQTANITFENQTSNGTVVVINRAVLPDGGFIAIHHIHDANETPTPTTEESEDHDNQTTEEHEHDAGGIHIGNSTFLEPGVHENVTIMLNQTVAENQTLEAALHEDTNDNQQWDFPEADPTYVVAGEAVHDTAFVTIVTNETITPGATTTEQ